MSNDQTAAGVLSPELEAIAAAADERLRAETADDQPVAAEARRWVAEAAAAAILAGAALGAIADAERAGEARARQALTGDVLRHVARAAKRKAEAEREYKEALTRAARLGLSHREIARPAGVSHGTIRAELARATPTNGALADTEPAGPDAVAGENHLAPFAMSNGVA